MMLQLIGKLPTRLLPWENHGWHVALRVVPRGFVTRPMPAEDGRQFTAGLDMREGAIVVECSDSSRFAISLAGRSVAAVHCDLADGLDRLALPAPVHGGPNEIEAAIPFARDTMEREWNADAARRLHGAFISADGVFTTFRSLFLGKSSPSHLFWGAFDIAVTRFSGRRAPVHPGGFPNLPDAVTRDAYSHEVISAGFCPGGNGMTEAAFYTYAYPSPAGIAATTVRPAHARWHEGLGEFVLPYAAVATSNDPAEALMAFLQSTYGACAEMLDWPADLTISAPAIGSPAQEV
ncbi:hypothetical protein EG799_03440 [Aurantiacibacter spongiae]|uniref:Uncharacterized protein n=2 Tax=Aurantiacibacter spongiae TaxID=2488860 RepID=A0A3N5CTW2_9SPHN|nr:hypothetical protein EG799_03440 [Aurantiacibacter spongiae]